MFVPLHSKSDYSLGYGTVEELVGEAWYASGDYLEGLTSVQVCIQGNDSRHGLQDALENIFGFPILKLASWEGAW